MGRYLDDIDPYHHLVSTHWSDNFGKVNKELAGVRELDLVLLDGYYQGTGASKLFNIIVGSGEFARDMHKPCLITEFGGNPWGDSMGHIWHLHHLGLWAGFMNKLAGVPFFWWFSMIEEKDMYGRYEAISKFIASEDRSGAEPNVDSEREGEMPLPKQLQLAIALKEKAETKMAKSAEALDAFDRSMAQAMTQWQELRDDMAKNVKSSLSELDSAVRGRVAISGRVESGRT